MEWDEEEDGPYPDFFFPNGYYWGDMKHGLPNGRGEAAFHDGSHYNGFFEGGEFQSPWWIERFGSQIRRPLRNWKSLAHAWKAFAPYMPSYEQFQFSGGGIYFGWFKDGLPDTSMPDDGSDDAQIFQYSMWVDGGFSERFSSGWTFQGHVSAGRKTEGYFCPELGSDSVLRNLTHPVNSNFLTNIRLRWRDQYHGKWVGEDFHPRSFKKIWDFPTFLETTKGSGIRVNENTCKVIEDLRRRHLQCLELSIDKALKGASSPYPKYFGLDFAAYEKAYENNFEEDDWYRVQEETQEMDMLLRLKELDWTASFEYYYKGEFKDLIPHGKGELLLTGPYSYVGEFREGKYHGEGVEVFHGGVTRGLSFGIPKNLGVDEILNLDKDAISAMNLDDFVSAFTEDRERGEYHGQFVNGIREGRGILELDFDEDGIPWKMFEGEFANGKPTVDGVWTYPGKESLEKSAKEIAFRIENKQTGAPKIDWEDKEECWQNNSGACVYCGKSSIEAPVSFWWEIYPKLTLVLACNECSEDKFSNLNGDAMDPLS